MANRKNTEKITLEKKWRAFIQVNAVVLQRIAVPSERFETIGQFNEFLLHSSLSHDDETSNRNLVSFIERCIDNELNVPVNVHSLAISDQEYLKDKYGDKVQALVGE